MFLATEPELKMAADLIARVEQEEGVRPLRDYRVDLLCDNFSSAPHNWSYEKAKEVSDRLLKETWGVAAFHMSEAWQKYPLRSKRA